MNDYFRNLMLQGADPVLLARQVMQERASGGGVRRLLIDQYPTHYLPEVGRQVMAAGGMPEDDGTHPSWIPTRLVTSKRAAPSGSRDIVDLATLKSTPDVFQHNVDLVRAYPNVTQKASRLKSHDKLSEHFIEHVADNLLALHDAVPEEIRNRSRLWYDGARKITDEWSKKYGVPDHSVAGTLAALSPQKDWFQNVSLAERVLEAMKGQGGNFYKGFAADAAMEKTLRSISSLNKEKYEPMWQMIRGKTLSDIDGFKDLSDEARARAKAMWIRLHDETYNDKGHRIITPEGGLAGPVMTDKNMPAKIGWGSLGEIAKAIQSVEYADRPELLSVLMGERHKVRNFFNNILNPNSPNGDVTIDTHAVAAGLYRPLSGNSLEVSHNFKNYPGADLPTARGTAMTGVQGLYPLYAEAYRRAAQRRGILPREMQSITWEAVRGLFPDTFKTARNNARIDDVWKGYRKGLYDQAEARRQINEIAGGVRPPSWFVGGNGGADEKAQYSGDAGELSGSGVFRKAPEEANIGAGGGAAASPEKDQTRLGFKNGGTPGERYETAQDGPFYRVARRVLGVGSEASEGIGRAERQGSAPLRGRQGPGAYGDAESSAPSREIDPFKDAHEYTMRVHGRPVEKPDIPESSLAKQSAIGRVFMEAVKEAPEYKQAIFNAYARSMPEVIEQSGARNYDELMERSYRQMAKETSDQFDALPIKLSFHRNGEGDYPHSPAMIEDVKKNGHLFVFQGGDRHDFLHNEDPETGLNENEKFRAVHDYFGHAALGNGFGPKGEEKAWAIHSQMYSPLARLAMSAETRGQNSFVNYTPINAKLMEELNDLEERAVWSKRAGNQYGYDRAMEKKKEAYQRFQFAPQKAVLLPPEFLDLQYKGGMPDYMNEIIKPEPGTAMKSALTHYSNDPGMTATDPTRYGTGIPGDERSRLRSTPGAVRERSYFYLGEPGQVEPEAGLGPYRYRGESENIYDMQADPMNFKTLAREASRRPWSSNMNPGMVDPNQFGNDIERLAKEYGYSGVANPNAAFPMAAMFEETPVERRAAGGNVKQHPALKIPGVHIRTAEAGEPFFHGDK